MLERLAMEKNSSLLDICKLQRKWSVMNVAPSTAFTTLHFLRNLWMGPISNGSGKACHWINTLAYWAFVSYEEKKVLWIRPLVLHSQHFIFFVTYEWAQLAVLHCMGLERIAMEKHSSLLGIHKLQRKWSVVNMAPGTTFTTLYFHCNLQMGPISSVTLHGAGKACHGQTL